MWSLNTIEENSKDERYQRDVREAEMAHEEELRYEREHAEAMRREEQAIAAQKAKQKVITFTQLKERK